MLYFQNPQTEALLSETSRAALASMEMHHGTLSECLGHSNIKNIFLIQDAYEAGHLNYLCEFLETHHYNDLKAIVGATLYPDVFFLGSFYNPSYFDMKMLDSDGMQTLFSRLKPNVDASNALLSLLKEGTHFTDCRAMAMMARMLTIWDFCIHSQGEQKGTVLFNQMYGEANADTVTPESRRLLFSQMAEFSGLISVASAGKSRSSSQFPINPLSCFVGYQSTPAPISKTDLNLNIGSAFFFANHPDYSIKHPAGAWAGFDMFYYGKGKFSGFGLKKGVRFLSQAEINQLFIDAYQQPHSRYELSFMRGLSLPIIASCRERLTVEDLPTYLSQPCTFRPKLLQMFCNDDLSSYYPSLERFIAQPSKAQLKLIKAQIAISQLKIDSITKEEDNSTTHTSSTALLPAYNRYQESNASTPPTDNTTTPPTSIHRKAMTQ
ncbi:hypothetical protein CC99x_003160 [Candidatus Berkiella cookevillensis]|uniref:Uncharacterized protein n=1 Tax=Candidatus Berkiella cookevillensis TaxID=437022 RepID=A0A0Q9YDB4_9GAMM|nr:hypothetical protein [Candidatus Berkiella cookevillensis]MCS5707897.1 hypothetical protein [Candidatus Berkiella cookevillensis]